MSLYAQKQAYEGQILLTFNYDRGDSKYSCPYS